MLLASPELRSAELFEDDEDDVFCVRLNLHRNITQTQLKRTQQITRIPITAWYTVSFVSRFLSLPSSSCIIVVGVVYIVEIVDEVVSRK